MKQVHLSDSPSSFKQNLTANPWLKPYEIKENLRGIDPQPTQKLLSQKRIPNPNNAKAGTLISIQPVLKTLLISSLKKAFLE